MKASFKIWTAVMLTSFIIVLSYNAATAQSFKLAQTKVSKSITVETVTIDGAQVQLKKLATGNYYVDRVSAKSGKQYKQYLGYKTAHLYNGSEFIYSNKDETKYWILGFTRNGTLKKLELEMY